MARSTRASFDDLTLVAPHDDDPFATTGFVEGAGTAYGVGLEAGVKSARYGIVMSYGLAHVRRSVCRGELRA